MTQSLQYLPRAAIDICTQSKSKPARGVGNSALGIKWEDYDSSTTM